MITHCRRGEGLCIGGLTLKVVNCGPQCAELEIEEVKKEYTHRRWARIRVDTSAVRRKGRFNGCLDRAT